MSKRKAEEELDGKNTNDEIEDANEDEGNTEGANLKKRKFYCLYDKCGRNFSKKSNLVAHEKAVHYEIKPFACDHEGCGRSFGFKHVLMKHQQSVHIDGKVRKYGKY